MEATKMLQEALMLPSNLAPALKLHVEGSYPLRKDWVRNKT